MLFSNLFYRAPKPSDPVTTEEKNNFLKKLAMVLPKDNDNRENRGAGNRGRERNPPRNREPNHDNRIESPSSNPIIGNMPFMDQMNPR